MTTQTGICYIFKDTYTVPQYSHQKQTNKNPGLSLPFCCYDDGVVNPPCCSCSIVATETERENDMTEENNNTAESLTGQTQQHGSIITIQTTLGDEGNHN